MAEKIGAGGKPQNYNTTDGKYKEKEASRREDLIKKYSSDPGKDLESKDYLPQKVAMTKQEWALYYSEIQKAERGEFTSQVMVLNKNTRTIFIETSKRATLVIDNNNNKVILSKFFRNYDEMVDYMNAFVRRK